MQKKKYDEAIAHLKLQKRLEGISVSSRRAPLNRSSDPFESLVRSIIYQQLSGKSAASILNKLLALFDGRYPTPREMAKVTDAKFKKAGVSPQKRGYLRDLAKRFLDGTIDPTNFKKMSDEEIREHLLVVKGIGRWTTDMFLIFTLYRPDVLPTGDLGIQKGFKKLFKLKELPDAAKMERLAKAWQPHRTVASWYLWEVADGDK